MPSNRVLNTAAAVALTLATEVAVATVTPAAPNNQAATDGAGTEVWAELVVTGAVSATTCTVKLRRGSGTGGTDILASDVVAAVTAAATDTTIRVTATETDANFNGANGIYTVTATAAGAAQTARRAVVGVQPLSAGV